LIVERREQWPAESACTPQSAWKHTKMALSRDEMSVDDLSRLAASSASGQSAAASSAVAVQARAPAAPTRAEKRKRDGKHVT
jgi:hypothetical protein